VWKSGTWFYTVLLVILADLYLWNAPASNLEGQKGPPKAAVHWWLL
jgi:hypothetical protein